VETTLPPSTESEPASSGPPNEVRGASSSSGPSGEPGFGAAAFAVVLAVLAIVIATVVAVYDRDGSSAGGTSEAATIELNEFALTPAALTVPAGGAVDVTNTGSVAHNLAVSGTDIATADLAAGESETLDLSSLDPGEYEIICTVPGHADSGMTGTLTVTSGDAAAGLTSDAAASESGDAAAGSHAGHQMTATEYDQMSQAMNETIAEYPAETEGTGNQVLEPTVRADGVKEFDLTADVTPWEVEPGGTVDAWTYNGAVPGPQIHVEVGDRVRIVLHNELPMATDLHLHGINIDNAMDGVAPVTQDLVEPGGSFTYEFTADEPAVAMYHAHHHGQLQVPNGMLGTIFVGDTSLPAGQTIGGHTIPAELTVAQELPLVLNDSGVIGYSLNGKSFPATAPIAAAQGDWILVHYFNEGGQIHPMHLHQFDQVVVAKDGFPLDHPYLADTVNVAPGERYSVLVHLDEPGTWVWHCHILDHVERDTGMYGMVTAVVVS
jgi:FtsP/CotA-like multicopper oxidase with cupredoxin domain/plastocyanin